MEHAPEYANAYPQNILRNIAMTYISTEYFLVNDVDIFPSPMDTHDKLRAAIACEHVIGSMAAALGQSQLPEPIILVGTMRGEQYTLAAPSWERSDQGLRLTASEAVPVRVAYHRDGVLARQVQASSATIRVDITEVDPQVRVHVEMDNATVTDPEPCPPPLVI